MDPRRRLAIKPRPGAKRKTTPKITVATNTIIGPEATPSWNERTKPATPENTPNTAATIIMDGSRRVSKNADEAGVISMAKTMTTPVMAILDNQLCVTSFILKVDITTSIRS